MHTLSGSMVYDVVLSNTRTIVMLDLLMELFKFRYANVTLVSRRLREWHPCSTDLELGFAPAYAQYRKEW